MTSEEASILSAKIKAERPDLTVNKRDERGYFTVNVFPANRQTGQPEDGDWFIHNEYMWGRYQASHPAPVVKEPLDGAAS